MLAICRIGCIPSFLFSFQGMLLYANDCGAKGHKGQLGDFEALPAKGDSNDGDTKHKTDSRSGKRDFQPAKDEPQYVYQEAEDPVAE